MTVVCYTGASIMVIIHHPFKKNIFIYYFCCESDKNVLQIHGKELASLNFALRLSYKTI